MASADMYIEEITSEHADAYFDLRLQSEREFPQFVGFNAERELAVDRAGIGALLAAYPSEGTVVWGAFEETQLIGTLVLSRRLSPKYRHKAFLWGMYVVPACRGSGAARSLMQFAVDWAAEQSGIVAISLQVTTSNERGQHFYRRFGFTTFGTEQRSLFAQGRFHGVHYMELELKHA